MLPHQIQNLISQFAKFPGIGPRQATRFAFYLLRNDQEISYIENILKSVRENVKLCGNCFLPGQGALCSICVNPKRDKNITCLVEKETDALNLEKTGHFQGNYYVLGGFIDPLEKNSLAHKRLNLLMQKLHADADNLQKNLEIILALAPRREGDFTSLYIETQLKPIVEQGANIKTTRLGRGLSSGAELEYADAETLKNALEGRR